MTNKTYNWTTEKGAKVELTIAEGVVKVDNYADGWNVETAQIKREVVKFTVNGTAYAGELGFVGGDRAVMFKVGGRQAAVIIPENIREQIYAREIANAERAMDLASDYENHYNTVQKMMAE